ncbi:MAG: 50S ribosomal protein L24 [Nitrososphaerales archaeon]
MPSRSRIILKTVPHHKRGKMLSAHLSDDLRAKYGIRSLPLRKGDTVKILRGEYAGVEGKVTAVYRAMGRIAVEGVTREKIAGGTAPVKIHASKVMITSLNLDDKWRQKILERKGGVR